MAFHGLAGAILLTRAMEKQTSFYALRKTSSKIEEFQMLETWLYRVVSLVKWVP